MKHLYKIVFLGSFCGASMPVFAEVTATVTVASDYLFNGVSQTDEGPALQGSLDWANDGGWYAGTWASNVDFGESTDAEVDLYVGYTSSLNEQVDFTASLLYYTYHGASYSNDYNYFELMLSLSEGIHSLTTWYAWDYAGTGAGHTIIAYAVSVPVSEQWSMSGKLVYNKSMDDDKFEWEDGDSNYINWRVAADYSFGNSALSIGVEGTDLDTYGDTRVIGSFSHTFEF